METKKNEDKKEGINEQKGGRKQEWNKLRMKYGKIYGRNKEENYGKGRGNKKRIKWRKECFQTRNSQLFVILGLIIPSGLKETSSGLSVVARCTVR